MNSKRQITDNVKFFSYEMVPLTAKTCSYGGLLKHLKFLLIMGGEKKYNFRNFTHKITNYSNYSSIKLTKKRLYVY